MAKLQATPRRLLKDIYGRFRRWHLNNSVKTGRRGYRLVFVFMALVMLWFVSSLKSYIGPQSKFFRVPENSTVEMSENPHITDINETEQATEETLPPPTSVLHPNTPTQAPINPEIPFTVHTTTGSFVVEYSESFPQHGKTEPGQHYRIENSQLLAKPENRANDSLLIICVFNDAESWGTNRSVSDFFNLIGSWNFSKAKMSVALLTSSEDEFHKAKGLYGHYIRQHPRLSLIFRNDFAQEGLDRVNRHDDNLQAARRRMLARYRNYALLSTLETWHQHVLWLDADINVISADILPKMIRSGLDIVHPVCAWDDDENNLYDRNAWTGHRKVRSPQSVDFVPGELSVKNMLDYRREPDAIVPLDSVGGSMLYVRADVHRQGVIFPAHYVIGSEWGAEGYDGIETEGLCYSAHFLGFKCWGMPKEIIYHSA
ncbi:hypothetical protein PHYBOEH_006141 [Phytophthora boehmeriae]|uniref:Uncharacterized protein n=1 Tax=Phytophthora boehmeriae TaxID=109152 RepID=A0A8T1WNL7_9STRA|nr:hypothetical protein PHYBOEH_006141 [Phytophthora boehmeriae]